MKKRFEVAQPMTKKIYEPIKIKKNVFLTSFVKTVALSKVLERY